MNEKKAKKTTSSLARMRMILSENHKAKGSPTYTKQFGLNRPPKDEKSIKYLAEELIEWARTTQERNINMFPIIRGYSPKRFFQLADLCEDFADALDLALEALGAKREESVFCSQIALATMPLYSRAYRMWKENERARGISDTPQIINVVLPDIPRSDMVPSKE